MEENKVTKLRILYLELGNVIDKRIGTQERSFVYSANIYKGLLKDYQRAEHLIEKEIKKELKKFPIYNEYLKGIKGMNLRVASGLISLIKDIKKFEKVSSLNHYIGLHVKGGIAPKEGSSEGQTLCRIIKEALLNPTKNKPYYREMYENRLQYEKEKIYPQGELAKKYSGYEKSDIHVTESHAENRAKRYMTKKFIEHLFNKWWELEAEKI